MNARWSWLCIAFAIGGCTDATQIMLVVDTDLAESDFDRIEITVVGPSAEEQFVEMLADESRLPLELALVPADSDVEEVRVVVQARLGQRLVVERTAVAGFVEGEARVLRVHLLNGCRDLSCRSGDTCRDFGCGAEIVGSLPVRTGPAVRTLPDGADVIGLVRDIAESVCTRDSCAELAFGASCESSIVQLFAAPDTSAARSAAVEAGRVRLNNAEATACALAFEQIVPCPSLEDFALAFTLRATRCDGLFVGTVPEGGSCVISDECAGDSFCEIESQCGRCRPRKPLGASCDNANECAAASDELLIACEGDPPRCLGAEVDRNRGLGEACIGAAITGDRVTYERCAANSTCNEDVCVAVAARGAACDAFCQSGSICLGSQCVPFVSTSEQGASCDLTPAAGQPVVACDVLRGLDCIGNQCVCRDALCDTLFGGVDALCASRSCDADFFCDRLPPDPADWRCVPRRADGQTCTSLLQCDSAACSPAGLCFTPTCL